MTDENVAAAPASQAYTRESLLPEGWDKPPAPEQTGMESERIGDNEANPPQDEPDTLAPSQETEDEQAATDSPPADNDAWSMGAGQFANQAGIDLHELNHNILFNENGEQKTISQIRNEAQALRDSQAALLRERKELQERVNQADSTMPQPGISPEAQALLSQAQMCQQALTATDWSQVDAATAANQKLDLQMAANQLQQQAQAKQAEHMQKLEGEARKAWEEAERQTRAMIPEWADPGVQEREWRAISDWMSTYGFRDTDMRRFAPHERRFLRDAHRLRADKEKRNQPVKRVQKVSKTLSAGARSGGPGAPGKKQIRETIQNARKKGGRQAEIEAIVSAPLDGLSR